jgi:hypothetical protein
MTTRTVRKEFENDEEFFRYHLARHGRDRSLFSLWQLLNATPLPLPDAGTADL